EGTASSLKRPNVCDQDSSAYRASRVPCAMGTTDRNEHVGTLTQSAGQVGLDGWTSVRVSGKDRASFLHNMCTNDIRSLAEGSGCESFFCDVKGKIVGHVFVLAAAEEHLLLAAPGLGERLVSHLDRYVVREDVQLADQTASVAWTLIAGRNC